MKEKKFHIITLILSLISLALMFFGCAAEAVIAGSIAFGFSVAKYKTYHTKLSLVLSSIAVLGGLVWLGWFIYMGVSNIGAVDYWLFTLIFGKY